MLTLFSAGISVSLDSDSAEAQDGVDYIAIHTQMFPPGGVVEDMEYALNQFDNYVAWGFNYSSGVVGEVLVRWTTTNSSVCGVTKEKLYYTFFSPLSGGTCRVIAEYDGGLKNSTGTLTVIPWVLDYVLITDSPDGSPIENMTYVLGENDTFFCSGYNQSHGFITTELCYWFSTDRDVGILDPAFAKSTTLSTIGLGSTQVTVLVWVPTHDPTPDKKGGVDYTGELLVVQAGSGPRPPTVLQASLAGGNSEDVTIKWSLSRDDGTGLNSVIGYDIFRSSTYNQSGADYGLIATTPSGTTDFIDKLAGQGDPKDYFYRVCAIDISGNSSCATDQAGKFTNSLSKGANLLSIPLVQSNDLVDSVLQTGRFDKVWSYVAAEEDWRWHMVFKQYAGQLDTIDHKIGFWVNVTEDSSLTVAGIVPLSTTLHLKAGWNLVGFPSFDNTYSVAGLKAETGASRVESLDSSAPSHSLKAMNEEEFLLAGQGYWVYTEADTIWIVTNP